MPGGGADATIGSDGALAVSRQPIQPPTANSASTSPPTRNHGGRFDGFFGRATGDGGAGGGGVDARAATASAGTGCTSGAGGGASTSGSGGSSGTAAATGTTTAAVATASADRSTTYRSPSFTSPSSAAKAATVCVRSLLCTASVWSTAAQKAGLRSSRSIDDSGTKASCTLRTTAEGGGWPVTARYSTAPSA
ncbi:hypothetical protein D9M68_519250 [compost metagenome]